MNGSQPAGRTLLGFNQPFQATRPSNATARPASFVDAPRASPVPPPTATEASNASEAATETPQQATPSHSDPAQAAPIAEPSHNTDDSTSGQHTSPKLVDYSFRAKRKPPASADSSAEPATEESVNAVQANEAGPADSSACAVPAAPARPDSAQPATVASTALPRDESTDEVTDASALHPVSPPDGEGSVSRSLLSSPARKSRRGYTDDSDQAGPSVPRDLLAQATAHQRAGEGVVPHASFAGGAEEDSARPYPPGLAMASDSPSMRSRRGVLLKSQNSTLSGRRNRRRGSGSATDTMSGAFSASGEDTASLRSSSQRGGLAHHVESTDADAGPNEGRRSLSEKPIEDDDDDAESILFQAESAISHGSYPSDGAESGKVQGTRAEAPLAEPAVAPTTVVPAAVDTNNSLSSGGDSGHLHADEDEDESDEGEESNEEEDDGDGASDTHNRHAAATQPTLHAPLFAGTSGGAAKGVSVRSPSASFSSTPPPVPARRVRAPPAEPHNPPNSSPTDHQRGPEDAQRRRRQLELNQKMQAERAVWEKHILDADWEELEVARYLNQFGKHVHSVKGSQYLDAASFSQPAFPTRFDWTTYPDDGQAPRFNAIGYSVAWMTAFLSYISPSRLTDLQRPLPGDEDQMDADMTPEEFRWGALRASSERLYLSSMPLYETLGGYLRHAWRWESKLHTFAYMVAYTFLWWRGLLMSSLIFGTIMLVLSLKTFPPRPDALREILSRQKRRAEETRRQKETQSLFGGGGDDDDRSGGPATAATAAVAAALPRSKYSLAVEATRKYGMQTSVVAGTLADGHERAKNFALWRSPRATWRLLFWLSFAFFASLALKPVHLVRLPGAALGIVFFIIGPIAEYKPEWLGMEWSNPLDWVFAGVPNDAQYSMEILRTRAARGKPLISDPALLMRPDETQSAASAETEAAAATPGAGTNAGGTDWTKWADAVMKGKSMAITGTEILSGTRALNLPRFPVRELTPASSTSSALLANLTKGVNRGLKAIEDHRNKGDVPSLHAARSPNGAQAPIWIGGSSEAEQDGTYWCVHDRVCGHLVITPKSIVFRSLFAKRPRGRRGLQSSASQASLQSDGSAEDQPLIDPTTGELTVPESSLADPANPPPKVKILLEIPLDKIVGLRKISNNTSPSAVREATGWTAVGKTFNQLTRGEGGLQVTLEKRRRRGTNASFDSAYSDSSSSNANTRGTADLGEILTFGHLARRDEAFNRLLAITPRQWHKVY